MGIVVQKFGGSSVADTDKLKLVSNHIIKSLNEKNKVIVVVSAQGKTTDELINQEKEITINPIKREHDVLISVGEQITIAKLAIYLNELGYKAKSYTGWQVPILTDSNFGNADIIKIDKTKILKDLEDDYIVIVAGFQGINKFGEITTLGRGGSDTTAVALAGFVNAEKLIIYTDVDGVYDEDPRLNKNAKKIDVISYDKMIEMADKGAKVLHNKCVRIAKEFNIPIIVKSTFEEGTGTIVK